MTKQTKKMAVQVAATQAANTYFAHADDKAMQGALEFAIKQYALSGTVKFLDGYTKKAWGTSASDYRFVTDYIKDHTNARRVKNAQPVKYVKAKKPEQTKACGGKWYTPMHKECNTRKAAAAKRKAEYKFDIAGEFATFVSRAERYAKNDKTTDNEHAAVIIAQMKKLQAELVIMLES